MLETVVHAAQPAVYLTLYGKFILKRLGQNVLSFSHLEVQCGSCVKTSVKNWIDRNCFHIIKSTASMNE